MVPPDRSSFKVLWFGFSLTPGGLRLFSSSLRRRSSSSAATPVSWSGGAETCAERPRRATLAGEYSRLPVVGEVGEEGDSSRGLLRDDWLMSPALGSGDAVGGKAGAGCRCCSCCGGGEGDAAAEAAAAEMEGIAVAMGPFSGAMRRYVGQVLEANRCDGRAYFGRVTFGRAHPALASNATGRAWACAYLIRLARKRGEGESGSGRVEGGSDGMARLWRGATLGIVARALPRVAQGSLGICGLDG